MPTLRVVSWNIENLVPALIQPVARQGKRVAPSHHLSELHEALGMPDIFCLQEVRVRPRDLDVVARMWSALPGYSCHFALCNDPENGRFRGGRVYGVVSYVKEALQPRQVPTPEWDREGRVCASRLNAHGILLVNVYAVNGTDRPHYDHGQSKIDGDRHAFKRRFQSDLLNYVQRERGADVLLLAGDWNVSRMLLDAWPRLRTEYPHALARSMFNETLMPALDVVDAFRELHPIERRYTWFNRRVPPGKLDAARVDFILISRAALPRVTRAAVLDEPATRYHSDHAPVRVDIMV